MTNKTLLDEFAMAALTGFLSYEHKGMYRENEVAKEAYDLAEAMMEEHKKRMEVNNDK